MTEHSLPADRWRAELRRRLLLARKDRDGVRTALLRSALSAIDNAETPEARYRRRALSPTVRRGSAPLRAEAGHLEAILREI